MIQTMSRAGIDKFKKEQKESLRKQLGSLFERLTGEGVVESTLVDLALSVRNELKNLPDNQEKTYLQGRFQRLLMELSQIDYNLSDEFYKKCR